VKVQYTGAKIRNMPNGSRTVAGRKFCQANNFTVEMTEEEWDSLSRLERQGLQPLTEEEEAALDADLISQEDGQEDAESDQDDSVGDLLVDDELDDSFDS